MIVAAVILVALIVAVVLLITNFQQPVETPNVVGQAYNYDGLLHISWSSSLKNSTALIKVFTNGVTNTAPLATLTTKDNYIVLNSFFNTNIGITNSVPIEDVVYKIQVAVESQNNFSVVEFESDNTTFVSQPSNDIVEAKKQQILLTIIESTNSANLLSNQSVNVNDYDRVTLFNSILFQIENVTVNGRKIRQNKSRVIKTGTYTIEYEEKSSVNSNIFVFRDESGIIIVEDDQLTIDNGGQVEYLFGLSYLPQQSVTF
jgi:hypothetical protein